MTYRFQSIFDAADSIHGYSIPPGTDIFLYLGEEYMVVPLHEVDRPDHPVAWLAAQLSGGLAS